MTGLTIVSARWANLEGTAAEIITLENGAVAASALDTPDIWAELLVFEDEGNVEPFVSAGHYTLFKSVFIERMTPEEAEVFEIKLNAHELAKLRLMYHAVEYFVSDDPLLAVLHWELVQEFGETRADELLALNPTEEP